MHYQNVLTKENTLYIENPTSKKQVLEAMSNLMAASDEEIDADDILKELVSRERIGSTGIGNGIAIPHARLAGCKKEIGVLIKTAEPIPFDANDDIPVNIFFGLLVPQEATEEHLQLLAGLASVFSQSTMREQLNQATDSETLYQIMMETNK